MDLYLQQKCHQVFQSKLLYLNGCNISGIQKEVKKSQQTQRECRRETMAEKEALFIRISALQCEHQKERRVHERKINELEAELEHVIFENQQEKKSFEDERQCLQAHAIEQDQQRQQLENTSQNLHEELATCQIESDALHKQNQTLQDRLGSNQAELVDALAESLSLRHTLVDLQAESESKLADAHAESAALQVQFANAQDSLAALQQTVADLQLQLEANSQRELHAVDITPWNVPRSDIHMSLEEIGRGGWGVVLRGIYEGEAVAVKQPHRDLLDQRLLDRLKRETRVMIQISHPNLVRIIAVVFDEAAEHLRRPPLIVTELLDMNLRHCYQQRRLQPRSRVPIFLDVARGLHYMHNRQESIIHRDVSAPNILLKALPDGRWRAKVSDFGSANLARLSVTAGEGAIIYTAPEAFPPRSPDAPRPQHTTKIDVYSFGILMCEVVTEEQPDPDLYQERLGQVQRLSGSLHSLIVRCTDHDPIKRPTMATVIQELNGISLP